MMIHSDSYGNNDSDVGDNNSGGDNGDNNEL